MEITDFERLYPFGLMDDLGSVPEGFGAIYMITNLVNGKVYVGQTWLRVWARWKGHIRDTKTRKLVHFHNAIAKYSSENFSVDVLDWATNQTDLDALETLWIIALGSIDPKVGYNMTYGGKGGKHSARLRKHHSLRMKEAWEDPDFRDKMLKSQEEIRQTPEFHENLSVATKAYWSSEAGQKQRAEITASCWKDPEYRENQMSHLLSPENRKQKSQLLKELWNDPEFRKKQSDSDTKKKMSESAKQRCGSEEARKTMSERAKAVWEIPGYREEQSQKRKAQAADPIFMANRTAKQRETRLRKKQEAEAVSKSEFVV